VGCPYVGWDFALNTATLSDGGHTILVSAYGQGAPVMTQSHTFVTSNGVGCTQTVGQCQVQCFVAYSVNLGIAETLLNDCLDNAEIAYLATIFQAQDEYDKCKTQNPSGYYCDDILQFELDLAQEARDASETYCYAGFSAETASAKTAEAICASTCAINPCHPL
jgi:hypothetical protein